MPSLYALPAVGAFLGAGFRLAALRAAGFFLVFEAVSSSSLSGELVAAGVGRAEA